MTKRIFKAVCIAATAVLAASILLIMGVLYDYFTNIRQSELRGKLDLAAAGVETGGVSYLNRLDEDNCRLTLISNSGEVLFDSKSDSSQMENHLEREEVKAAFETGFGESERYSSTLTEKTFYCAKLLKDGSVLRVSASQATVPMLLVGISQPIAVVCIVAVIISFILASRLSKRIVEPLNSIDLDKPLENESYDEISPLLRHIAFQQTRISAQKEELARRKAEFLTITSNMNEGLILLSADRKILSINRAAESFLKVQDAEEGMPFSQAERSTEISRAIDSAERDDRGEARLERGGKSYQINVSGISDCDELTGFVILIFDITENLSAERARREFTANVSHELKTPLQTITGRAELIENGLVKKSDLTLFAGSIRSEACRLVSLIDDIIRLSRLDEGESLPKTEFDLLELAKEICGRLGSAAEKKNVSIKIEGESSIVCSVKPLVSEILFNLCDNAVKYNVNGGSVSVNVSRDRIVVSDTGIGIPAEHLGRVFERFYRVDKSHSKETGGTGLGLSIVKHAAEDIGAEIDMTSDVGKGTTVTVNF